MATIGFSVQFVGLDCSKTTINGMSVKILIRLREAAIQNGSENVPDQE